MASTIVTKNSSTASAVPLTGDLTQGELAVNVTDKRLFTKNSGGTVVELGTNPASLALPNGTANGVLYLNGSKVATSGSALTFNGTSLGVGSSSYGDAGTITTSIGVPSTTIGGLQLWSTTNGTSYVQFGDGTSGTDTYRGFVAYSHASDALLFGAATAEGLRLTSTSLYTASGINVGIGTSSPLDKLDVVSASSTYRNRIRNSGANEATLLFQNSSTGTATNDGLYLGILGSMDAYLWNYENNPIIFGTNNTQRMVLDSAGNLGLGVTPSAWASTYKAFQMGGGSLISYTGNDRILLGMNTYLDSGGNYTYVGSTYASGYNQVQGQHQWYTAPSGTAGNAITFTQAMTLDASGNLLVGTTSSSNTSGTGHKLSPDGRYAIVAPSTTADTFNYYNSTAGAFRFYVTAGGTIFATSTTISAISDQRLKENVRDLEFGLSEVMALKPRRFDWKEGKGQDKKNAAGFIAQEFETVFPDSVGTSKAGEDGVEYKNINHEELIPTLVKAIQEQQALIQQLTARVAQLESN